MRTPLYDSHVKMGARVIDFHGWDMPVWYSGIKEEHMATRGGAGIFDASHMGEIWVSGPDCAGFLNRILTVDVAVLEEGKVKYTFFLNEEAGIIDDIIVYCTRPKEEYMLCVNSSNIEKDFAWLKAHRKEGVEIVDKSPATAMIALQGPLAGEVLERVISFDYDGLKRFYFQTAHTSFGNLIISRTGYTGSDGVEIFMNAEYSPGLWAALIDKGATPCGLGARDTLRLEMGYPLHGNDLDETTTPLEAGLKFAVDMNKPEFIGRPVLEKQLASGLKKRLVGLVMEEKGIPRQGYSCGSEGVTGSITSGSISPVLDTGIALAYMDASVNYGDAAYVVIRDKKLAARIKKPPFVKTNLTK
ncbi:MAG TPA: glycine cleavage system aminomethyltransferase GcvT [Desulfomonilia bacterium]